VATRKGSEEGTAQAIEAAESVNFPQDATDPPPFALIEGAVLH
jgi:hypothetical protein